MAPRAADAFWKGAGLGDLWLQALLLAVFGALVLAVAVRRSSYSGPFVSLVLGGSFAASISHASYCFTVRARSSPCS